MADETGDDAGNFVNAMYGPGSKNSCSIVIRVVQAKTMAPYTRRWQAAIDTTYNQDGPTPPSYSFGSATDGTSTFAGGGLHEITSQIHNGMLRIDNPPAYFNFGTNFIQPGRGAGVGSHLPPVLRAYHHALLRAQRPQRPRRRRRLALRQIRQIRRRPHALLRLRAAAWKSHPIAAAPAEPPLTR